MKYMKKIQPYIIAGMTILIVVLAFYVYSINSSVKKYKQEIELFRLKSEKTTTQEQITTVIDNLSIKSRETVKKSDSIIKKIKHEIPKISDTTDNYMLQYIRDFRPKQD
jgi:predicted Holliday junction resolvase-like endonuclease